MDIKKHIPRRYFLHITGSIYGVLRAIRSVTLHGGAWTKLRDLLAVLTAGLSLLGTICIWAQDVVLAEIPFFNYHGTGRPPKFARVLSLNPVSGMRPGPVSA